MQKIVGSIMVITACTVFGFEKSRELQFRLKDLETLKRVFTMLKSELEYTKAPFGEAFLKIGKKMEGIYKEWLIKTSEELDKREKRTLQEVWNGTLLDYLNEIRLTPEEKEELLSIGKSLGYKETITLYLEQLEVTIQRTRDELKTKKKLYQSMGVMFGIFLVIVFF